MLHRLMLAVFAVAALAFGPVACHAAAALTCASIEDLARKPGDFRGKELCVAGVVSERVDVPLVDYDYFKVVKNRGGIWVQGASPPPVGAQVVSWGKFVPGDDCNAPLVEWVVCESKRETE